MNPDEALMRRLIASEGSPLTGEELARGLGIFVANLHERIGVWRQLGFEIERSPSGLIRLVRCPDVLVSEEIQAHLAPGRRIGRKVLVFESTASTNDVAERLADEGAPGGLAVFAESQTDGRGRHGRSWISPPRKGLWLTLLLRPALAPHAAQRLTVLAGVALAEALRRVSELPVRIKWPNDLLCRGRKVAGILTEISAEPDLVRHALIGVGINVNLETADFPDHLRGMATSLKIEAGRAFPRVPLAAAFLAEVERAEPLLSDAEFPRLIERWVELDETLGRQVSITGAGARKICGLAMNLDTDGALLVRCDDGRMERVIAGDVTLDKSFV